jgi:hypothetical protein
MIISYAGGAAVSGRLQLAGTEARPTGLFSYEVNDLALINMHRSYCKTGFSVILSVAKDLNLL